MRFYIQPWCSECITDFDSDAHCKLIEVVTSSSVQHLYLSSYLSSRNDKWNVIKWVELNHVIRDIHRKLELHEKLDGWSRSDEDENYDLRLAQQIFDYCIA